jgi:glycosyltransferase involved in cell wall biosynthesis
MSGAPDVSVVIPTRGSRFLPLALQGALWQEDVSLEVVVVDDASTDGTTAILDQTNDARLRVIRHDRRRGPALARNTGLTAARGEWVAFLDDDDLWSPRKLRTQLDAANAQDAALAYGAAVVIDADGRVIAADFPPPPPEELPAALLATNLLPAPGSNVIAKTALVRDLGGFDENARFDDWDMWIRLAAAGRAASTGEVLVGYRHHSSNHILSTQHEALPGIRYLEEKHRALSQRYGVEFDELAMRRWVAWAYRNAGKRLQASRVLVATALACRTPRDLVRAALVPFGTWAIYPPRSTSLPPEPDWLARYRVTSPPPDR